MSTGKDAIGTGHNCDRVLALGIRVDQRDARRIGDVLDRTGFYSGILQTIAQLNAKASLPSFPRMVTASQTRGGHSLVRAFSAREGAKDDPETVSQAKNAAEEATRSRLILQRQLSLFS